MENQSSETNQKKVNKETPLPHLLALDHRGRLTRHLLCRGRDLLILGFAFRSPHPRTDLICESWKHLHWHLLFETTQHKHTEISLCNDRIAHDPRRGRKDWCALVESVISWKLMGNRDRPGKFRKTPLRMKSWKLALRYLLGYNLQRKNCFSTT